MNKKTIALLAVAAVIIAAVYMMFGSADVDKRIVGKWRYNSNSEAVMEFKRNGDYIANKGTEHEEKGTFKTVDGLITVIIDGQESASFNYRVIDDDNIQIERRYWGGYDWETKWVDFYKVT